MSEPIPPPLARWPFLAGDVLLLAAAAFVATQSAPPLTPVVAALVVLAVAAGAVLAVLPFALEHRAAAGAAQTVRLTEALERMRALEAVAAGVTAATTHWQVIQDQSSRTATAAREVAEQMATEAKAFADFMRKANDSEKATLRLEAEKLRRNEAEWLQVVVRIMDHVFALHQAAVRSGKTPVIEQISHFQAACRAIARRMGVVPVEAAAGETFDAQRHRTATDDGTAPAGARVTGTLASGVSFQGRLIRPVLVAVENAAQAERTEPATSASPEDAPEAQPEAGLSETVRGVPSAEAGEPALGPPMAGSDFIVEATAPEPEGEGHAAVAEALAPDVATGEGDEAPGSPDERRQADLL